MWQQWMGAAHSLCRLHGLRVVHINIPAHTHSLTRRVADYGVPLNLLRGEAMRGKVANATWRNSSKCQHSNAADNAEWMNWIQASIAIKCRRTDVERERDTAIWTTMMTLMVHIAPWSTQSTQFAGACSCNYKRFSQGWWANTNQPTATTWNGAINLCWMDKLNDWKFELKLRAGHIELHTITTAFKV